MQFVNKLDFKVKTALLDFYNEIIRQFSWRVNLISLTGSLANNEATLLDIGNKEPALLSDIEIFLSLKFWSPFQSKKISSLEKKAFKRHQIKFSIISIPEYLLKKQFTFQFFDIYNNSKLIYGNKSELDKIPVKRVEKIPKWEGIRLLFNRLIELLEYSEAMVSKINDTNLLQKLVYSCIKALLACCESILLIFDDYKPTYQERLEVFIKYKESRYSDFTLKIQNLSYYIEFATNYKLKPFIIENYKDLWFHTKEIIIKTLEIYLKNYLKTEGTILFQIDHLSRVLPRTTSRNLYYFFNLLINRHIFFNLRLLKLPIQFILLKSGYHLLSAIGEDSSLKTIAIQKCEEEITKIFPVKRIDQKNTLEQFKILKTACLSAWRLMPQYIVLKNK